MGVMVNDNVQWEDKPRKEMWTIKNHENWHGKTK